MLSGNQTLNHLDVLSTLNCFEGPGLTPVSLLEVLGWHDMHGVLGLVVGSVMNNGSIV